MPDPEYDNKRTWSYSLATISEKSTVPLNTVREHKRKGIIIPGDLLNVSRYIVGNKMRQDQRDASVTGGKGIISADEWGEPVRR